MAEWVGPDLIVGEQFGVAARFVFPLLQQRPGPHGVTTMPIVVGIRSIGAIRVGWIGSGCKITRFNST